jgi:hypothetical protein
MMKNLRIGEVGDVLIIWDDEFPLTDVLDGRHSTGSD